MGEWQATIWVTGGYDIEEWQELVVVEMPDIANPNAIIKCARARFPYWDAITKIGEFIPIQV